MPFWVHNESETFTGRSNFLDLLKWYVDSKEGVKKCCVRKCSKNDIIVFPSIQKGIVSYCEKETIKAIIKDLN